ncbi:glycosyltransferase [Niabella sp. CJ426]|uniref:glycosyltransferase n=1 Tax=Niabella sp. CJ426 TaxID=3393740 RepID=UPI003D045036
MFAQTDKQNVKHIYVPKDLCIPNDTGKFDEEAAKFITMELQEVKNVIFHFNWINHGLFSTLLKKNINCKTLLTKHCIPWRDLITNNYTVFQLLNKQLFEEKNTKRPMHPALMREHLNYATVDHIICVTNFATKSLTNLLHIPPYKQTVIYNGIDSKFSIPSSKRKSQLRKKYRFSDEETIVLFAGRVTKRKGIQDLLIAFQKLLLIKPEVRLIIAGDGEHNRMLGSIKQCWSKVTFTGELEKYTLYDFYKMADIGIVPSYVEQCSYSAIEMMHSGLPIIISDVDGLSEIVPDGCGLKVPIVLSKSRAFINPDKLKEALLFFIDNPKEAKDYAKRARYHAAQNFNAEAMAQSTINVYHNLLSNEYFDKKLAHSSDLIKNGPLVSVLIACFNAGKFLKECINSVLNQSYTRFELLILDDGSDDDSSEILEEYNDPRITKIKNTNNKGIVYSSNQLLSKANGKYIARFDADDIMDKNSILRRVSFLETHQGYAMVGGSHYIITDTGQINGIMQYSSENVDIKLLMFFKNPFCQSSVMIKSDLLKKIKYSEKYKHCEDYNLWFNIAQTGKLHNLSEFLTSYRIHHRSDSHSNIQRQKENSMELISDKLDQMGIDYSSDELAIHAAIHFNYGRRYFNTSQKIAFAKIWIYKVLYHLNSTFKFSSKQLHETADLILKRYCGINTK